MLCTETLCPAQNSCVLFTSEAVMFRFDNNAVHKPYIPLIAVLSLTSDGIMFCSDNNTVHKPYVLLETVLSS